MQNIYLQVWENMLSKVTKKHLHQNKSLDQSREVVVFFP